MITTFLRPETPAEAVIARRDRPGAVYFAGGTDVVAPHRADAACAVSPSAAPARIEYAGGIGALVTPRSWRGTNSTRSRRGDRSMRRATRTTATSATRPRSAGTSPRRAVVHLAPILLPSTRRPLPRRRPEERDSYCRFLARPANRSSSGARVRACRRRRVPAARSPARRTTSLPVAAVSVVVADGRSPARVAAGCVAAPCSSALGEACWARPGGAARSGPRSGRLPRRRST
jgi:hypothetical protein